MVQAKTRCWTLTRPCREKRNFFRKSDKKGSQNRVQLDHSHSEISQFFREFPGFPKIQVEMPGAGKRGEAGAYPLRKNHSNLLRTNKHTLALGNPGSLKKRRLRRKNHKFRDFLGFSFLIHTGRNVLKTLISDFLDCFLMY